MEEAEDNGGKFDPVREFTETQSECQNRKKKKKQEEEEDEDEDMELTLGLSMNGRFGVDPTRNEKLKRASSIANLRFEGENSVVPRARGAGFEVDAPLSRARSLPVWTEVELRQRKELQSARRMEARKKRMEKLKNLRVPRDKGELTRSANSWRKGPHEVVNGYFNGQRFESGEVIESSSQGSIGPPRSGSSGSSDLIDGPTRNAEVSPTSWQNLNGLEPMTRCHALDREAKGPSVRKLKNTMRDMPYVTTRETGPNGRRMEGFLYGYKKGEDVRIMCVCHGMFLTPKEFVEHGGVQGDVENPLKNIVVSPFPLL